MRAGNETTTLSAVPKKFGPPNIGAAAAAPAAPAPTALQYPLEGSCSKASARLLNRKGAERSPKGKHSLT